MSHPHSAQHGVMADQLLQLERRAQQVDDTNAPTILAIVGVFTGVALLIVALRGYVRARMLRAVGTDDYVIFTAMLFSVGVFITFIGETSNGVGRHIEFLTPANLQKIYHWEFFHSLLVMCGISLVKISIAFFLFRLVNEKWYKRFLTGMVVFLILFTISCAGTLIFSCIPVSAYWDFAEKKTAKCFSNSTFTGIGMYNSVVNIITDVLFALLPVPMIWNLQVNKRTKVTLTTILALGFFACAAAIVKTYLQTRVLETPDAFYNDSYFIWNSIELNVGIVASSLPALRPLFATLIDSTKAFITSGGRSGNRSTVGTKHRDTARYYAQKGSIGLNSMPRVGDTFHANEQAKSANVVTVTAGAQDDDSEEGILPPQMPGQERHISVKREYGVAWEEV